MLGAGFALALAALTGSAQATQPFNGPVANQGEMKATPAKQIRTKTRVVRETIGGLDLVTHGAPGLSPKEYGMRFGNGASRNGKVNKLACSHKAKVGRRKA